MSMPQMAHGSQLGYSSTGSTFKVVRIRIIVCWAVYRALTPFPKRSNKQTNMKVDTFENSVILLGPLFGFPCLLGGRVLPRSHQLGPLQG